MRLSLNSMYFFSRTSYNYSYITLKTRKTASEEGTCEHASVFCHTHVSSVDLRLKRFHFSLESGLPEPTRACHSGAMYRKTHDMRQTYR